VKRPGSLRDRLDERDNADLITTHREGATAASQGLSLKNSSVSCTSPVSARPHPLDELRRQRRPRRIRSRSCPTFTAHSHMTVRLQDAEENSGRRDGMTSVSPTFGLVAPISIRGWPRSCANIAVVSSHTQQDPGQVGDGVMRSRGQHIQARTRHDSKRGATTVIAILVVFGLVILMIFKGYDPSIITAVVTATSLAAAELVRRIREPYRSEEGSDKKGSNA